MNKRQKKKRQKKCLTIIADEFNLLTMTDQEREKALEDFYKFRDRFAYRKKYKDLKEGKPLWYLFPPGQKFSEAMKELANRARGTRRTKTVTQNIEDFK